MAPKAAGATFAGTRGVVVVDSLEGISAQGGGFLWWGGILAKGAILRQIR